MPENSAIALQNVTIRNGAFELLDISLEVPSGRYGVLMGGTGCGKTTILEAICGLKPVAAGRILLGDRDVTALKPAARGIGFVPQDGAIFETMSVYKNLAYALTIRRWKRDAIDRRVRELAELLGIEHLLNRLPHGLSGGEAQRVALGRALACYPRVLCLDEPLSALDSDTHGELCTLLKDVQQYTHVTTLHITHNRPEAETLADIVFHLKNGKINGSNAINDSAAESEHLSKKVPHHVRSRSL